MSDLIRRTDAIKALYEAWGRGWIESKCEWIAEACKQTLDALPTVEPNLILPERMEHGDIYEVGETIVVMNHDDYYDLLCKSWMPKRGEWIDEADKYDASFGIHDYRCSNCNSYADEYIGGHEWYTASKPNFCPYCGADMRKESE